MVEQSDTSRLEGALGRHVMAFGDVEESLALLVSTLLGGAEEHAYAVVSQMSYSSLMRAVERLIELRGDAQASAMFAELKGPLHRAEERRNTLLHSWWYDSGFSLKDQPASSNEHIRLRMNRRRGDLLAELVSVDEIDEMTDEARRLDRAALELLRKFVSDT